MFSQSKPPIEVREIPRHELSARYQKMVQETVHPVVLDEYGTLRYKQNDLVLFLHRKTDLNEMHDAWMQRVFSTEQFMQFYRDIGYSLDGFEEVWGK